MNQNAPLFDTLGHDLDLLPLNNLCNFYATIKKMNRDYGVVLVQLSSGIQKVIRRGTDASRKIAIDAYRKLGYGVLKLFEKQ